MKEGQKRVESAKRQRGQIPRESMLSSGAASTRERERAGRRREEGELISSTHARWAALAVPRDSAGIPHNIPSPNSPRVFPTSQTTSSSASSSSSLGALFTSASSSSWILPSRFYRLQDFLPSHGKSFPPSTHPLTHPPRYFHDFSPLPGATLPHIRPFLPVLSVKFSGHRY